MALAMYAQSLLMLQNDISHETTRVKHIAYADDFPGAIKTSDLKAGWDLVSVSGSEIGYIPNATKTDLIVKTKNTMTMPPKSSLTVKQF